MNKRAFTLMELLLTITVLAIVGTSTIPTFFGGAKETLEDAKKSNMHSAYQNARTGANILISIATAKDKLLSGNLDNLTEDSEIKNLEQYAPATSRTFIGKNGSKFVFGANVIQTTEGKSICVMTYATGEDPKADNTPIAEPNSSEQTILENLNTLWDAVFAGEPQQ